MGLLRCWELVALSLIWVCEQRTAPMDQRPRGSSRLSSFEFRYMTEFQSHEPEFDYLKSLEIEEKINQARPRLAASS